MAERTQMFVRTPSSLAASRKLADDLQELAGGLLAGSGLGSGGLAVIPQPTPLTRLHYFDGKFLRASDLELEQRYLRGLVARSNQAGGAGVVHGLSATLAGDALSIGDGLAIDPEGRLLLLPETRTLSLAALLEASRAGAFALGRQRAVEIAGPDFMACELAAADTPTATADGAALYLLTLCHAEALCGEEDVYGQLCAEACATSTERPYVLEGVLLRAVPLRIATALPTSTSESLTSRHLRSQVAAAYFEDERKRVGSLISAAGLASPAWCLGGGAGSGACVPIGLFARAGATTLFFDAWTARRERIEPPPARFWAQRLAQRPLDVYLAQVLQFQCQLADCLRGHEDDGGAADPCAEAHALLRETAERLARMLQGAGSGLDLPAGFGQLDEIRGRLADAADRATAAPRDQKLLGCGIVELPSAGYLPVDPASNLSVNEQVRRFMGGGVDLRFCVVRPDFVPHAFEEARHMERISLLHGLDHPDDKPKVDVLVPDGTIDPAPGATAGQGYAISLAVRRGAVAALATAAGLERESELGDDDRLLRFTGAARGEELPGGGLAFHLAGAPPDSFQVFGALAAATAPAASTPKRAKTAASRRDLAAGTLEEITRAATRRGPTDGAWVSVSIDRDPFALALHDRAKVDGEGVLTESGVDVEGNRIDRRVEVDLHGDLVVIDRRTTTSGAPRLAARLDGRATLTAAGPDGPTTRSLRVQQEVEFERSASFGAAAAVRVVLPDVRLFSGALRTTLTFLIERSWPEPGHSLVEGGIDRKKTAIRSIELVEEPRGLVDLGPDSRRILDAETGALGRLTIAGRELEPLFALAERADDEVRRPDHAAHVAAIGALDRLGERLDDPEFAAARARKLFPPPAATATGLTVRATRDWVLFHRRRDKVCSVDAPTPAVPDRRYRLVHIELGNLDERARLLEVLAAGASLASFKPEALDPVTFAGGLPAVETAPAVVRAAWNDATRPGGRRIALGAIASQGDALADGDELARARLNTLAGLLADLTPRTADAPFETYSDVPRDLPAVGLDGAVLFATIRPAAATVPHGALLLRTPTARSELQALAEQIKEAGVRPELFANARPIELGLAAFEQGTATAVGDGLDTMRAVADEKLPPNERPAELALIGLSISTPGTTAADHALHRQQSEVIVRALRGVAVDRDAIAGGTAALPLGGEALTIVAQVKTAELGTPGVPAVFSALDPETGAQGAPVLLGRLAFDDSGKLATDAAYEGFVDALKRELDRAGGGLRALAFSGDVRPRTSDPRWKSLVSTLKAGGYAAADATTATSNLAPEVKNLLIEKLGAAAAGEAFVLTARRG